MALRNPAAFFAAVRTTLFHGRMVMGQVAGTNVILSGWDKWRAGSSMPFVAYSLATAYHETAQTMLPIEEIGRGRGRAYGVPTGPWKQCYYGRGDIQLTWEANYAHATGELRAQGIIGRDQDLVHTPDLARDPHIAAAILVIGMSAGWFTGRRLGDYFNQRGSNWLEARRIVNGLDCAGVIAGYGEHFHEALTVGGWY